jgi:hypothetical protein
VLRFFALRHCEHYVRGMQGFLDLYMSRARAFSENDIGLLRRLYVRTICLATDIYGTLLFRPFDPAKGEWEPSAQRAFYDAVMVGLSRFLISEGQLRDRRAPVVEDTRRLFKNNDPGTFTGRGNSKVDVEGRINKYAEMVKGVLA